MCYKSRNIHFNVPVDRGRPGALDKVQLAAFSAFCGFWTDCRGPNGATNVSASSLLCGEGLCLGCKDVLGVEKRPF